MFEIFRFWIFFYFFFKVSRIEKRQNQSCSTGRYMHFLVDDFFYLKSFRTQNLCFKINDFDIHIFLNFSNDLGRRNNINQSCSTGRCMQLYSWWLCHFKIKDFAIHIYDFGGRNHLHQSWSKTFQFKLLFKFV
jgi:hypothetical protein